MAVPADAGYVLTLFNKSATRREDEMKRDWRIGYIIQVALYVVLVIQDRGSSVGLDEQHVGGKEPCQGVQVRRERCSEKLKVDRVSLW
jgi:hypothetical protein